MRTTGFARRRGRDAGDGRDAGGGWRATVAVGFAGAIAVAGAIAGCSGDDRPAAGTSGSITPGGSSGTSGAVAEAGADAGDGGADAEPPVGPGLCEALEQRSQTHQELLVTGDPPAATGGAIAPGRYVLNEMNAYAEPADAGSDPPPPGPTGRIARSTLVVTGKTMRFLGAEGTEPAELPADQARGAAYRVVGTSLETTTACPAAAPPTSMPFSSDGTYLTLHVAARRTVTYLRKP